MASCRSRAKRPAGPHLGYRSSLRGWSNETSTASGEARVTDDRELFQPSDREQVVVCCMGRREGVQRDDARRDDRFVLYITLVSSLGPVFASGEQCRPHQAVSPQASTSRQHRPVNRVEVDEPSADALHPHRPPLPRHQVWLIGARWVEHQPRLHRVGGQKEVVAVDDAAGQGLPDHK